MRRRLAVTPHALFEGPRELGLVRLAHEIRALMVECWVQKEALVVELEVLVGLTDAALAESQKLLSFGKGPHGDGPFFKSNRHVLVRGNGGLNETGSRAGHAVQLQHRRARLYARVRETPNATANRWVCHFVANITIYGRISAHEHRADLIRFTAV